MRVILRGLKAAASIFLWHTVRVLADVPFHRGVTVCSDRFGKVAFGPKMVAPDELFQIRELFAQQVARPTLQHLRNAGHGIGRPDLDQQMHMEQQI